ncbi:MAG: 50S ribosomal protein L35 [Chloroflexi bacterium]|nr:50S ribosomal protein L35 [Chloroflexota bacterium]
MPKMKTHRGAAKRIKITGGGKYTSRKGSISHRKTRKSNAANAAGDEMFAVARPNQRRLVQLMPYAKANR